MSSQTKIRSQLKRLPVPISMQKTAIALLGSSLLVAGAKIAIPLPWTPVPVTLQTAFVFLWPLLFGPQVGFSAVLMYLTAGAVGLPVFSKPGAGLAYMAGPTGGYLMGFLVCALVLGFLSQRGVSRSRLGLAILLLAGHLIVYSLGVLWLSHFVGSLHKAVIVGVVPFLLGDLLKASVVFMTISRPEKKWKNLISYDK